MEAPRAASLRHPRMTQMIDTHGISISYSWPVLLLCIPVLCSPPSPSTRPPRSCRLPDQSGAASALAIVSSVTRNKAASHTNCLMPRAHATVPTACASRSESAASKYAAMSSSVRRQSAESYRRVMVLGITCVLPSGHPPKSRISCMTNKRGTSPMIVPA